MAILILAVALLLGIVSALCVNREMRSNGRHFLLRGVIATAVACLISVAIFGLGARFLYEKKDVEAPSHTDIDDGSNVDAVGKNYGTAVACRIFLNVAESSMLSRQADQTTEEAYARLREIPGRTSLSGSTQEDILRASRTILRMAYEKPIATNEKDQLAAVGRFSGAVYSSCMQSQSK